MAASVSSKNLKGSTELTVIANIKPGLVKIPDPMSHTTRLERLLEVLFQQRKLSVELGGSGFVGPLEKLRSLHFVHWAVIDSGTRLLLTVAFDKPWEPYIRSIVDDAGPILDVIFCHCEGYEQATTRHGYHQFAKWVRDRQQTTNFFFADFPELTVDDIRHLQNLRGLHDNNPQHFASSDFPLHARVGELKPKDEPEKLLKTVLGLYRLKSYYPPYGQGQDQVYSDRAIFNRAVRLIAEGYTPQPLDQLLRDPSKLPQQVQGAFKTIIESYNDFKPWYEEMVEGFPPDEPPREKVPPASEYQANILKSYDPMHHGCVALLRLPEKADLRAAALRYLAEHITSQAVEDEKKPPIKFNVAFTYGGLKAAGLPTAALAALPVEFREGMQARAGALGDVASHHPERWSFPSRNWPPDRQPGGEIALAAVEVVVVLQTAERAPGANEPVLCASIARELHELAQLGFQILHVQPLQRDPKQYKGALYREHFGYLDGVSAVNPKLGIEAPPAAYGPDVSIGEALIGYPNDHGDVSPFADDEVLRNGSFLVVRKMSQDVAAFEKVVGDAAGPNGEPLRVKALLMGRGVDGQPLASGASQAELDKFDYEQDSGQGCPLQAHVRLANPRTPTTKTVHGKPRRVPRLIRRGFSYGPRYDEDPRAARGLVFMAFGASIAEQYEVVQRWLNGANSTGLPSTQNCPISGPVHPQRAPFRYRGPSGAVSLTTTTTPFVGVEWGLYLLAPSITGLLKLAEAAGTPPDPGVALVAGGERILTALLKLDDPLQWKKVLEGQGEREKALALWAAIRARGGVLKTSYGVLVGTEEVAMQVLKDESRFSVREYWRRMKGSHMPMHLGMDRRPLKKAVCPVHPVVDEEYVADCNAGVIDYERESVANATSAVRMNAVPAFVEAFCLTREALDRSPEGPVGTRRIADLFVVGEQVVAALSQKWFGLPDGELMTLGGAPLGPEDPVARCPADFTYASQYIFRSNPDDWTRELSQARGKAVHQAGKAYVAAQATAPSPHPFYTEVKAAILKAFRGADPADLDARIERAIVGAVDGFVAANWGSFVTTLSVWIRTQDFWNVQLACEQELESFAALVGALATTQDPARQKHVEKLGKLMRFGELARLVHRNLMLFPVPSWLHRTALVETTLNGVKIMPGDRIALGLGSIALDKRNPAMLFGGEYSENKGAGPGQTPAHACPARSMASGVVLGMLAAVLERRSVRADNPLAITFEPPPPAPEAPATAS